MGIAEAVMEKIMRTSVGQKITKEVAERQLKERQTLVDEIEALDAREAREIPALSAAVEKAEATFETSKAGYPLHVLMEFAHNTLAANDRDSGFWVEAGYGNPREAGTWGATYTYGWIQQDLTPSAFVFSDIPGTNIRLNMIETSYVPKAGVSLDVTLHFTRRLYIPDENPNHLLTRLHVAAVIRF